MTTPTAPNPSTGGAARPRWLWLIADVAAVAGFVAMGRAEHDDEEAADSALEVAAPFVIGLVVAWLVMRAWRSPLGAVTGAGVWIVTLVLGLLGRRFVFGDGGTALAFVIVTILFLGLTLNGWRLLARAAIGRSGAGT